ncbi:fumarylacetoacetate hydrolase family protein [Mangrovihabitans endophyticus]|uniref:Ureidoglycolate lyase n=1 Tax=Mangrovihabitans endophyticus TaxID=1751298 RepID=A0A8J3BTK1_9ACTN|nr:fumarylacetoacetate hydrolase family protein [Mangrovihabitans endophyticus]GGK75776.1 ureidoglycolate lyase [Mangrovihabitans endophyticus]
MKLARFHTREDGRSRLGRVDDGRVTDLSGVPGVGTSMRALLPRLPRMRAVIEASGGPRHDLPDVILDAPIDDPQKYLAIGMNYKAHAEEARAAGIAVPVNQLWFNKQVSCIVGPHADIVKPVVSDQLDYEIELGVVIGARCRDVAPPDARSVIAGYLVTNDVSVRDWLVQRSPTFTLGKSFDTHGPMGPWLTTADEVSDPHGLRMRLTVNGEERQNWTTDDMIHRIEDQIAELTTVMTLMPGDVIATGTPAGIGAPTRNWLRPGDVVRAEIDGLGAIENRVVAAA